MSPSVVDASVVDASVVDDVPSGLKSEWQMGNGPADRERGEVDFREITIKLNRTTLV